MKLPLILYRLPRTVIMLVALTVTSCSRPADTETAAPTDHAAAENVVNLSEAQFVMAGLELGKLETRQISGTIKANGQLDVPPQQMVSVSVPLGGFLKATPLLQGTRVKKGQLIATIENLEFVQLQQDYLEASSQLEFAEKDYQRQEELARENVAAQKVLQQAKTTLVSWQSRAAGLKEKLRVLNIPLERVRKGELSSDINLYSPIDGYVTEVNVNIGKFVNPSDILFEIVDTEHLHAELTVFEKDIPKVSIGQKVRFTLANETQERTARVYLLGRQIGADRTIRIHCHIDKEDTSLLPGMYLKAAIETGGIEVPALPDRAIIDYQGKKYIFYQMASGEQVNNDAGHLFTMLEVNTGNSEMGFTEVILPDSFSANSQIVVKNAYAILSKMKNSEVE